MDFLEGVEAEEFLRELLEISDEEIERSLRDLALRCGEVGIMLAKARAKYQRKKLELQVLEAELAKRYRMELAKVTEKAVEEAVVRTKEWQELHKEVISAKEEVDMLSALLEALLVKRDMLMSYMSWKKEMLKIANMEERYGEV